METPLRKTVKRKSSHLEVEEKRLRIMSQSQSPQPQQSQPQSQQRQQTNMDCSANLYFGKFPYFRQPREIGCFSLDASRNFKDDNSQLKVFVPPSEYGRCCFDLNEGYYAMIHKDESKKTYINDLLKWSMLHFDKFFTSKNEGVTGSAEQKHVEFTSLNTDFVCWRGLLTRILCLPYENREDLKIAVIRSRGTYFMCQFDTESKQKRGAEMKGREQEMCAWGWKFEQYVTADKIGAKPDTERPVNNNEEYGVVVRSRLGSHSLVYGAEVDCIDPDNHHKYLELKTSRIIQSRRQRENFCRFKLIKFWAQSFLIGIQKIVCGFRDDGGIVRNLEDFHVKDIPKLADSTIKNGWNASVCFNFLDSFLSFVKTTIPEDDERTTHLFYWKPGCPVVYEGKDDNGIFHFLPDWFLKWQRWDGPAPKP